MNVTRYKQKQEEAKAIYFANRRSLCMKCLQPDFSCYCELIKSFDPEIVFVILIHPIEIARRIASGRMAHLCLKNSYLISGHDFTNNASVNKLLQNENLECMMLYPSAKSTNISNLSANGTIAKLKPRDKKLCIFVIDGTWHTAKKTVHLSVNLKKIPQICFTPSKPSNFRVRRQPRPECYSTIEAIHQTIELLALKKNRDHDHLLYVFDKMITRQIELAHNLTLPRNYR